MNRHSAASLFRIYGCLKGNAFQIVRHINRSMIILSGLIRILPFSGSQMTIFRMIQDQIFYTELLCQFAGLPDCAVIFFIRMEYLPVLIAAECLRQQPVRVLGIRAVVLIERFISKACKPRTVGKFQQISELFGFRGPDIKGGKAELRESRTFPVF